MYEERGTLLYLAATVVLIASAAALVKVAYEAVRRTVGTRMSHDFACATLERVQRNSLDSLQRRQLGTGELVQRITVDTRSIELLVFGVGFLWTSVWFWQVAAFCFATVFTQRFELDAD